MRWKHSTSYLALAAVGVILSGCDPVVEPSYRGESRLSLRVVVLNETGTNAEQVVPALAHVDDTRVAFRDVEYRNDKFGSEYRVDVYDTPNEDRLAPVNPFLAANVLVAREHIGAVIKSRLREPILLNDRLIPLHPHCWGGTCDHYPGAMSMPCAEDDRECHERQQHCQNGRCQVITPRAVLPEGVEDITGFASGYTVLYTPEAIPARSWAALELGAPDGLEPGYHVAKNLEPKLEARLAAEECITHAWEDIFAAHNEEHGTEYGQRVYSCLSNPQYFANNPCDGLPEGAEREELASALAAAEIDRGCRELAPTLEFLQDSAADPIVVRINGESPDWFPSVIPRGDVREEVCPGATADPEVRMNSYSGSLCPEGAGNFSQTDGSFGFYINGESRGEQRCELSLTMPVPPGYRFRKPIFYVLGYAYRNEETLRPTSITMTYEMAGEAKRAQHVVSGTLDGDFLLVDTPEITVPECGSECEATELELKIVIDIFTPDDLFTSLIAVEAQHNLGVEWTRCGEEFQER